MLIANFCNGKNKAIVSGAWQYDYGQRLYIHGLELPEVVEIGFSLTETGGMDYPRFAITKDGVTEVTIPDEMMEGNDVESDYRIYAFVFVEDEKQESGQTIKSIEIRVKSRPKRWMDDETGDNFSEIVKAVRDLVEEYKKSGVSDEQVRAALNDYLEDHPIDTLTEDEVRAIVNAMLGDITQTHFEKVDVLPDDGKENIIYLVPAENTEEQNIYDEYIFLNGIPELIGTTKINLEGYATKEEFRQLSDTVNDNKNNVIGSWKRNTPLISFMDDDCKAETFSNLFENVIKVANIPYMVACPPASIGDVANGYMKESDLKDMYDYGVDVACHHWNQYNMDDETLLPTIESYEEDLEKCVAKFAEWGMKVNTVAYPQGKYKRDYIPTVKKYFNMGFTVDRGINQIPHETFYMKRCEVFPSNGAYTIEDAKALVREVKENGGWLVFMTHAWYDTFNHEELLSLINYIKDENVEIVSIDEGIKRVGNLIEVGDFKKPLNELSNSYYVVDADGKVWANSFDLVKKPSVRYDEINVNYATKCYLDGSGGLKDHTDVNRTVTLSFDVVGGDKYLITCSAIYVHSLYAIYDADGNAIETKLPITNTDVGIEGDTILTDYEIEIPPNGVKMRLSCNRNIQPNGYKVKHITVATDGGDSTNLEGYVTEERLQEVIEELNKDNENGGFDGELPEGILTYTEQNLTEEQQMQARKNLGLYRSEVKPKTIASCGDDESIEGNIFNNYYDGDILKVVVHADVSDFDLEYSSVFERHYDYGSDITCWYIGNGNIVETIIGNRIGVTDVNADLPFGIVYYPSDGRTHFRVDETKLEKMDKYGVYTINVLNPNETEIVYTMIEEEYIPSSVPKPSYAEVGQTIVVSEVDVNGKPIAWECVDMPSGGGTGGGENGKDGITPHIGANGNWFVGETDTGVKAQGEKGDKGDDGKTPVKGTDYFTEADKQELVTDVLEALPAWTGGSY